jgi:protoporphyrinogen oxidase
MLNAVKNALLTQQAAHGGSSVIKTLIEAFDYPERGPGMMWEAVADIVKRRGSAVRLGAAVERIYWKPGAVTAVGVRVDGRSELVEGTHFVNSMPIRDLIQAFEPAVPPAVLAAAEDLKYRDFLTVALIVNKPELFPDNWIYVHDPDMRVGRIQNYKNWSPHMVPDSSKTCLGLEYFCFEGDGLWTMTDRDLVELGRQELDRLGLARAADVEDGTVVRMPKAYPVYDSTYAQSLKTVRAFLDGLANLQSVGRNGMHKYNNQDHSMLTAILATENILGATHDIWNVNTEPDYHEEVRGDSTQEGDTRAALASTQPRVPRRR